MNFFVWLALQLLVIALTPKPKLPQAQKYSLNDIQFPTASEDRTHTWGIGIFRAFGNVVWFGDYEALPVTRRVKVSLFKKVTQTYGYRYCVGMWLTLCARTCDELREIRLGDKVVWTGNKTLARDAVTVVPVNATWESAEGQELADGMRGAFLFFNQKVAESGDYEPLTNWYMQQRLNATDLPAYPNTLHAVWVGPSGLAELQSRHPELFPASFWQGGASKPGFISIGPQVAPLSFTLRAKADLTDALAPGQVVNGAEALGIPSGASTSDPAVVAAIQTIVDAAAPSVPDDNGAPVVDGDENAAAALLELLTTRAPGIGPRMTPFALDLGSFLRAMHKTGREGENLSVSFAYENERQLADVIVDLMRVMQGVFEDDPATGKLRVKLMRPEDSIVAAFTDDEILELGELTRTSIDAAPNQIAVPFIDRRHNFAERVAYAHSPSGQKLAGSIISSESQFVGCTHEVLARKYASREASALMTPLARLQFTAALSPSRMLKPGDKISVQHERLQQVLIMRVMSARFDIYGGQSRVEIEAVEDVFRGGSGGGGGFVTPLPPTGGSTGELPLPLRFPVMTHAPFALTARDGYDRAMYWALSQDAVTSSYVLATQQDSGAGPWNPAVEADYAADADAPAVAGSLVAALGSGPGQNSFQVLLPDEQAALFQSLAKSGQLLLVFGNPAQQGWAEWAATTSYALAGNVLNIVAQRGVLDTWPLYQPEGTTVYILTGYTVIDEPMRTKQAPGSAGVPDLPGAQLITARAESRSPKGIVPAEQAVSSERWLGYSLADTGRALAPVTPANIRAGGVASVRSLNETAPDVDRTASLSLSWTPRSRLSTAPQDWHTVPSVPEPNVQTLVTLEYEDSGGNWATAVSDQLQSEGATTALLDLAAVPAGARRIRARISAVRATGSGYAKSPESEHYWRLTS